MAAAVALANAVADKGYGARDTNAVVALMDATKIGTPEGRAAEMTRVKTAFPGLFYSLGSANGGAHGGSAQAEASGMGRMAAAYAANAQGQSRR